MLIEFINFVNLFNSTRGQESAGIVTTNGGPNDHFVTRKAMGLVNSSFSKDDIATLQGNLGIGMLLFLF